MSDVGMTGDYEFGHRHEQGRAARPLPAQDSVRPRSSRRTGPATLCGVAVETDDATGLAVKIGPVRLGGKLEEARPAFWA